MESTNLSTSTGRLRSTESIESPRLRHLRKTISIEMDPPTLNPVQCKELLESTGQPKLRSSTSLVKLDIAAQKN